MVTVELTGACVSLSRVHGHAQGRRRAHLEGPRPGRDVGGAVRRRPGRDRVRGLALTARARRWCRDHRRRSDRARPAVATGGPSGPLAARRSSGATSRAHEVDRAVVRRTSARAYTVGITGAPGAGKSTLTSAAVATARASRRADRRARHRSVVAVHRWRHARRSHAHERARARRRRVHPFDGDPWPPRRAGLGHAARRSGCSTPSGSRGSLVETVGVGQVEVEVAGAADTTVVVVNPGWGDSRPGQQGRAHGDRRRVRGQQGRPRRRRADRARPRADARPDPGRGDGGGGLRSSPRSGPPAQGTDELWAAIGAPPAHLEATRASWSTASGPAPRRAGPGRAAAAPSRGRGPPRRRPIAQAIEADLSRGEHRPVDGRRSDPRWRRP